MAKTLDSFPEGGDTNRPGRYPWGRWLDGQVWRLERGTKEQVESKERDYYVTTKSFRSAVTQACKAKTRAGTPGGAKTLIVEENGQEALIVQFLPGAKEDSEQ